MSSDRLIPLSSLRGKPAAPPRTASAADAGSLVDGRPRVYLETYGCQMNVADSDLITTQLLEAGYRRTQEAKEADVVLVNTCAVREKAEERVVARASELLALRRSRPEMVVGIVGCMAEHLRERLLDKAPGVDVVAGPDSYRRLVELVAKARQQRLPVSRPFVEDETNGDAPDAPSPAAAVGPLLDVVLDKRETYEGLSVAAGGDGISGMVTIQRGCDKFCTFCVVPFTRGRERGAAPREILRQVRDLVAAGYKEVTLLGQTVNSYRWEDVTFADLLRAVAQVEGLERIRFTSPYPVDFTDDVIAAMASEPKVCKYVHLPVQSGSDAVLARMRRGYTVDDYRGIVARLRAAMPELAFSTDILSGFCGETEEDHQATLALMREIGFDSAFMFAYSERDVTYAAKKLPDDVTPEIKKRRLAEIVALQERISAEKFTAMIGRSEHVLVHGPSKRDPAQLIGRTDGFKSVILPRGVGELGKVVEVKIARATMATLFAEGA
jgi:tRNA-2-methylthio-N6-dimethylallyladenosine synthase